VVVVVCWSKHVSHMWGGNAKAVSILLMEAFIQLHWVGLGQATGTALMGCHVPKLKDIDTSSGMMISNSFVVWKYLMPLCLT
jgi:hypothetical protein